MSVAADRNRKGDVEDVLRDVVLQLAEAVPFPLGRFGRRTVLLIVRIGRLVIDHNTSMPINARELLVAARRTRMAQCGWEPG